jgi:hypothetical protein
MLRPYSASEVCEAIGISLDTLYRTRQMRHDRDAAAAADFRDRPPEMGTHRLRRLADASPPRAAAAPGERRRCPAPPATDDEHRARLAAAYAPQRPVLPLTPGAGAPEAEFPFPPSAPEFSMTVKLPYIKWRDGRPRVVHSPRERARGFVDRDLKTDAGEWFSFEQAEAFSKTHHAEIIKARQQKRHKPVKSTRPPNVEDLLIDWLASPEVQGLAPASIASYEKAMRAVIFKPESREQGRAARARARRRARHLNVKVPEREREPMAGVLADVDRRPGAAKLFQLSARRARSSHGAGRDRGAVRGDDVGPRKFEVAADDNPRIDMQFDRPAGRVVMISLEEFNALVAAADAIDRASIGDAIYLGLFTGQRQTDRLALKDEGLINGRRHFRQSKTGAGRDQGDAAAGGAAGAGPDPRRGAQNQARLRDMPETIVVDESTGRPYNEHTYRHLFAEIRALAIKGHGDVPPCPSLAFTNDEARRTSSTIRICATPA